MDKRKTVPLENWRRNPDDFVIIRDLIETPDGKREAYLITNQASQDWYQMDDHETLQKLVSEMIEAGVQVISLEESIRMRQEAARSKLKT